MKTAYYIAANSQESRGGIYGFDANSVQTFFEPLPGASYLAFSPDRKLLYSVSKKGDFNTAGIYKIREDGSLQELDRCPTNGRSSYTGCPQRLRTAAGFHLFNIGQSSVSNGKSQKTFTPAARIASRQFRFSSVSTVNNASIFCREQTLFMAWMPILL